MAAPPAPPAHGCRPRHRHQAQRPQGRAGLYQAGRQAGTLHPRSDWPGRAKRASPSTGAAGIRLLIGAMRAQLRQAGSARRLPARGPPQRPDCPHCPGRRRGCQRPRRPRAGAARRAWAAWRRPRRCCWARLGRPGRALPCADCQLDRPARGRPGWTSRLPPHRAHLCGRSLPAHMRLRPQPPAPRSNPARPAAGQPLLLWRQHPRRRARQQQARDLQPVPESARTDDKTHFSPALQLTVLRAARDAPQ